MKEQIVDLLPEARIRKLYYDVESEDEAPGEGSYLVSVKRKTMSPGTVYHVVACRKVNRPDGSIRCYLQVMKANELLPVTIVNVNGLGAWVNDIPAHQIYWYSREKKK